MAAIRAAPGDDARGLVYADSLEEAGSPRVAYLRVSKEAVGLVWKGRRLVGRLWNALDRLSF